MASDCRSPGGDEPHQSSEFHCQVQYWFLKLHYYLWSFTRFPLLACYSSLRGISQGPNNYSCLETVLLLNWFVMAFVLFHLPTGLGIGFSWHAANFIWINGMVVRWSSHAALLFVCVLFISRFLVLWWAMETVTWDGGILSMDSVCLTL